MEDKLGLQSIIIQKRCLSPPPYKPFFPSSHSFFHSLSSIHKERESPFQRKVSLSLFLFSLLFEIRRRGSYEGNSDRVMQADQTVLSLRPGGGGNRGSRLLANRFGIPGLGAGGGSSSDLPLLRPHGADPAASFKVVAPKP